MGLEIENNIPIPRSVFKRPSGFWVDLLSSMKTGQSIKVDFNEFQAVRRQITRFSSGDKKYLSRHFYMMLLKSEKMATKQYRLWRVPKNFKPARNISVKIRPRHYWEDIFSNMKRGQSFKIGEAEFKNCQSAYIRYGHKFPGKILRGKCIGENKKKLKQYRVWRIK